MTIWDHLLFFPSIFLFANIFAIANVSNLGNAITKGQIWDMPSTFFSYCHQIGYVSFHSMHHNFHKTSPRLYRSVTIARHHLLIMLVALCYKAECATSGHVCY